MTKKPKLTETFADKTSAADLPTLPPEAQFTATVPYEEIVPKFPNLATFPTSRFAAAAQLMGPLGAFTTVAGPPPTPEIKPQREKVAIIGTAPSSRMLAPFADTSWEIWCCSPGNMNICPRVDVWFELHKNLHWPEHESYGKPYIEWLSKQTFPVYMQDQFYLPNALVFPKDEMVKEFGSHFFTSSFAWMMAFAISRGFKEIGLYGVDMASKDEYILQRQAFYFWLYKAKSLGIKVTIPDESDLMQPPGLYGYSEVTAFGRKMHARKSELLGRIAALEQQELPKVMQQAQNVKDNITYLKGAVEDLEYTLSIWPRAGHVERQD